MKNLQIQCSKPAIILNPHLKDLVLKHDNYYINNRRFTPSSNWYDTFPYSKFRAYKKRCTLEDLDNFYIVDNTTGDTIPLFMAVGCGKCELCRAKKAKEWSTRAMCEAQCSISRPFFITLTYNELNIPSEGVVKKHVQNFMKRLRINIERKTLEPSNIRYFLCAEYGRKTARPHYHALIYNVPPQLYLDFPDIVQRSWSYNVNRFVAANLPDTLDEYGRYVYKHFDGKRWYALYGYTRTSDITKGRVDYCMKYMKKEAIIPAEKNDVFFLSSRRGGLGQPWFDKHIQEYREHPQFCNIEINDIWSGETFRGSIPRYFMDKIAPTTSRIIPKEVRDDYKLWNYLSNRAHTLISFHYTPNPRVIRHYPTLYYHSARVSTKAELKHCTDLDSLTRDTFNEIDRLEKKLLSYQYDIPLSTFAPVYKEKHSVAIETYIRSLPPIPISERLGSQKRSNARSAVREIF